MVFVCTSCLRSQDCGVQPFDGNIAQYGVQCLATIQNADQILVVDDGRIVERGTHDELASHDGLYRRFMSIREKAEGWKISCSLDE